MKIEIEIPALDQLNKILHAYLNRQAGLPQAVAVEAPTPTPEPEPVEKPKKKRAAKKATKAPEPIKEPEVIVYGKVEEPTVEPTPEPEKITVDELTDLARAFIKANSTTALRAALDEVGLEGKRITEADPSFYPVIKEVLA